jgi:hypothetical protein
MQMARAARWLGYAGLLPAAALCLGVWTGGHGWDALAFRGHALYAALILSFIGGAWWGIAATRGPSPWLLALSVLPSLAAWPLALLLTERSMAALGLLFLALLLVDRRLATAGTVPDWWLGLRVPLSLGMAALCMASAVGAMR